jgi:hypothetical protein
MGDSVRITALKLFSAVFAKIMLLAVGFFAVLLDVCSLALGAWMSTSNMPPSSFDLAAFSFYLSILFSTAPKLVYI